MFRVLPPLILVKATKLGKYIWILGKSVKNMKISKFLEKSVQLSTNDNLIFSHDFFKHFSNFS